MSRQRIVKLTLDERTVVRRNADIEHERKVAIFDLLEENSFTLIGHEGGPYAIQLGIEDNRLAMAIATEDEEPIERVLLPLSPFRSIVKDYFMICESYFDAIKRLSPMQIEAIDMGRRGLHNEGSTMLQERLCDRITLDFPTARRLFTLLCVLHIRG